MIQLKVFTPKEANALIPELSRLIVTLRDQRALIEKKEAEIDALELVTDEISKAAYSGINRAVEHLNRLIADFNAQVDTIHSLGCFLKDVEMGLVDFYSVMEGKVVYLCWMFGEESVTHWHEVGEGFASRESLPKQES